MASGPEHGDSGGPLVDVGGRQLGVNIDAYPNLTAEEIKDKFGFLVNLNGRATANLGVAQITNSHTISRLKQTASCHLAQAVAYSFEPDGLGG
jgi:hypothetical protein